MRIGLYVKNIKSSNKCMYVYNKQPVVAEKLQQTQPSLKSMQSWNASFAETLGGDKGQTFFNMIAVFVRRFYVVASVQVSFGFSFLRFHC